MHYNVSSTLVVGLLAAAKLRSIISYIYLLNVDSIFRQPRFRIGHGTGIFRIASY